MVQLKVAFAYLCVNGDRTVVVVERASEHKNDVNIDLPVASIN